MPRLPNGGNSAASRTRRTSSADLISGTNKPWEPASIARRMAVSSAQLGMRTNGTRPTMSAARTASSIARGLAGECSVSSMTKSKPVSPRTSIIARSPVKHCIPNGIWLCLIIVSSRLSVSNMVGVLSVTGVGDRSGAGIGSQLTGCDAVDGAGFVVVGHVTADPDRTDDSVVLVADQNAARNGHEVAVGQRHEGVDEGGVGRRPCGQTSAAHAHVQCAVGLSASDAFPQQARAVFPREGHQPSGGVQYGNC